MTKSNSRVRRVKGVKGKLCPRCKEEKDLSAFPTDRSRKSGIYPRCRACLNSEWRERYRNGYKERQLKRKWLGGDPKRMAAWRERMKAKYAVKIKARESLRNAVAAGKVKKLPCEKCGELKSQGHHEDYSKPLTVLWLCGLHHREVHGRSITLPTKPKH